MAEFAAQVEAGALSERDRSLFYYSLEAAGVRDRKFLQALLRGDTQHLAHLSRERRRAGYLWRAKSRLGHVSPFASRDSFVEQVTRALAENIAGLQSIAAAPGIGSQCTPEGYVYAAGGPKAPRSGHNPSKDHRKTSPLQKSKDLLARIVELAKWFKGTDPDHYKSRYDYHVEQQKKTILKLLKKILQIVLLH